MKNTLRFISAALVLGIYFIIGTATSQDNVPFNSFIQGDIVNASDSCSIVQINFLANITPTRVDTVPVWSAPLAAGDTAEVSIDSFTFHTVHFTCSCDSLLEVKEVPFSQGPTTVFPTIDLDCD